MSQDAYQPSELVSARCYDIYVVIVVQQLKVHRRPVTFASVDQRHMQSMSVGYTLCHHPSTQRQLVTPPPPTTMSDLLSVIRGVLKMFFRLHNFQNLYISRTYGLYLQIYWTIQWLCW